MDLLISSHGFFNILHAPFTWIIAMACGFHCLVFNQIYHFTINVNGCVIILSFIKADEGLPKATNNLKGSFMSNDKLCLISNGYARVKKSG